LIYVQVEYKNYRFIFSSSKFQMLKNSKGPYPQVLEPIHGGYWVEGFIDRRQSDSDHMLRIAELDPKNYELLRSDSLNYYKQYFAAQVSQCNAWLIC